MYTDELILAGEIIFIVAIVFDRVRIFIILITFITAPFVSVVSDSKINLFVF
jgi:hypothetical protein